jgi:phage-related minor tail protein
VPNVGYATIQIIPSVRGISDELRRQLAGPAADAGDQAGQESGSRFSERWKAGLAAAGIAAGALLVAATVSAVEKERLSDKLSAQLGLSGKGAKQAGKVAGDLYSKAVVDSFEDGAAAVRAVMSSGLIPEKATTKSIEAITTKVADLANTFEQDLTGTANAASQMIRTGLAKDGATALDLLTAGFQSSADKAGDFVDTINEYGTQFRKAGLDGATAIGILNQAIAAGARDADIAADAIKEFTIRAVDGSKTSADGFKALGLNADDMAKKFALGGAAANGVLDITLDRLRSVKDPVKQSQTAVALFGTQAEDLGAALLAIDPTTAAASLDKVGGAAKRVGDTIRGNTSTELKILQRQIMGTLGTVVTAVVLPALNGLITGIRAVASFVGAVVGWFREWGLWLAPLAVLIGGVTLALNAQAIATGLVTAVFSIYRAAILAGTAVTQGFAAAQALLNAVMALNPITLIVIGLVALGVALVVAYRKSETFRKIVQGVWSAIQTGWSFLWDNYLKPGFEALMVGLRAIGTAASWLWTSVLSPVFSFIATAGKILATAIVVLVVTPIVLAFRLLAAVGEWLWGVLKPVFSGIGAAAVWLWNNGIKPLGQNVITIFRAIGAIGMWLWRNAIGPAIRGIGSIASWLYHSVIKPTGANIVATLRTLGAAGTWLWKNAISPAISGISATISWLYDKAIKPIMDRGRTAVRLFGAAFTAAKDVIGTQWDKVRNLARKPIQFVVDTVYNKGIVGVWNKVAGAFGAPKLDTFKFATGGVLPGYTPGRDVHLAALSGGEAVMRPEWTRAVGPGYVNSMNAAARGGGVRGVQRALGLPGFADGGIFGWVKGAASKTLDLAKSGVSWLKDGVKESALAGMNSMVRPLIDKISGSASLYRDMVSGIPKRMLSAIFSFSGEADKKLAAAGIGGKSYKAGLSWARTQAGKPYQWGGNGNPSWDCSGFLSAIESVIRGQKPHRRWATGAFSGNAAPAGWRRGTKSPYMIGITNAGVGHTAGTLNGINVESRGGDGVIVGNRARSYRDPLFTDVYGLKYDQGGWLQPGITRAVNATGQPEAVLTARQWHVAQRAVAAASGGLQPGDPLTLVVDGYEFHGYVDARAGGVVAQHNRQLISTVRARRSGG